MKIHTKMPLLILCLFFFTQFSFSQLDSMNWVQMMKDPSSNFYDVQTAFNAYWNGRTIEKGKGYKQFKRWEAYMEPRVYPSGDMKTPSQTYTQFKEWEDTHPASPTTKASGGVWSSMGPLGVSSGGGAGRLNFVRFDPTNTNIIYVGAPDGGLWKSTNAGSTWSTNTDQLSVIGCSDIAIDPTNTSIMYMATGDGEAGDSYSIGIMKSIDGGLTWNTTGLSWAVTQGRLISKLLMHPTTPSILLAATSAGIYRTTNSGVTWTLVQSTNRFYDMEFKPGDPNTVYASGSVIYKSTNNGVNWTQVTSGIPSTGVERMALGVSAANSAYVYILAGRSSDQGLLGIYKSTDSGASFTTAKGPTSPNLLGWNSNGGDSGGQAFYDLALAVSPTNANLLVVGGVNIWKSIDGGTTWALNAQWTGSGAPYVHADQHDIVFLPGSSTTYFAACDGGLFKTTTTGSSWTDISGNLAIAQQYRVGLSASTEGTLISGHQDNGINKLSASNWSQIKGGDGMDCMIDRTSNSIMYGAYVYGDYARSSNGGSSWTTINTGLPTGSSSADWLSVWHQDPVSSTTLYAGGRTALYKTTNSGSSWASTGTPSGSGTIIEFAIAPSNNQIIYSVKVNAISKSINGGVTWTNVTGTIPTTSAFTNVSIHNTNPLIAWITISGYSSANKVFKTIDGGSTWTNISAGLPNVPCNTIVFQNGSTNDPVYVGTDVGVYFRDNTAGTWVSFFDGLPKVSVRDLEIYYPTSKIRAATFGRGTWENALLTLGSFPPAAEFTGPQNLCSGYTATFTDASAFVPTSWSWSITPGTAGVAWSYAGGTSSSSQNIQVQFNTAGSYTIILTATNANGSNANTKTNYITIAGSSSFPLPFSEGFTSTTFPATNWSIVNSNASLSWARSASVGYAPTAGNSCFFNNFSIDDSGNNDELRLPKTTLAGFSSAQLTFDVAYAPYSTVNYDGLEVFISTDCGGTFTTIYSKSNTTLATAPATTVIFAPTTAQWRTETVNLSTYLGQANVIIGFRNIAGYGNNLYLDNINLTGAAAAAAPVASYTAGTTTICAGASVSFTNTSTNSPTTNAWTFTGGTPATSTATNPTITYNTAGVYAVSLTVTNSTGTNTSTSPAYITVVANPATPTITASGPISFCQGGAVTLTSSASSGNTWSNSASTQSINISTTGTYSVTILNSSCSATSTSVLVTVNPLPIVSINTFPTQCINWAPTTLTGSTPSGGTYSGIGVSSNTFSPSIAGVGSHYIYYSFTNSNSCTSLDSTMILVDACAGMNEITNTSFEIYPNPSSGEININKKNQQIDLINVVDETGRIVKVIHPKNETQIESFSLNDLSNGIYKLIVSSANTQKIIKITLIR